MAALCKRAPIREFPKVLTLKDYDVLRDTPHDPIGTLREVTRDAGRPSDVPSWCQTQFIAKNWTWHVKFVPPSPMVSIGAVLFVREAGLMFSVGRRHPVCLVRLRFFWCRGPV